MGKHRESKIREGASLTMLGILMVIGALALAWNFPSSVECIKVAAWGGGIGALLCTVGGR